ncbi:hypothetical protein GGI07_003385 [Coemansia sp. Benny D115]|nr:hypothetical protein GGI07_003385 [Coemansia sp. Benny D115]
MPFNDITLRANNAQPARRAPRQRTLLAALQAVQQRPAKRRASENTGTEAGERAVKRPNTKRDAAPALKIKEDESERETAVAKTQLTYAALSVGQALRQRRYTGIAAVQVSQARILASSLVSAPERVFQTADGEGGRQLPLACRYNSTGSHLALADEGGHLGIFDTSGNSGPVVAQHRWQAHEHAVFDAAWSPDGQQVVTAAADDTCRLWDATRGELLGDFVGHQKTVRAVDWRPDEGCCFASGGRDGALLFWDTRCNKALVEGRYSYRPVMRIAHAHAQVRGNGRRRTDVLAASITGVQQLRHGPWLVATAGAAAATVKIWDMRAVPQARGLPRAVAESLAPQGRARGLSSLALDTSGSRLYAACNDGRVYVHGVQALQGAGPLGMLEAPAFECRGFGAGVAVGGLGGAFVAAGSATGAVVLWEVDRLGCASGGRRVVLRGHTREAGSVAWNPARTQLASCADDGTMRLWDLSASEALRAREDVVNRGHWGMAEIEAETL